MISHTLPQLLAITTIGPLYMDTTNQDFIRMMDPGTILDKKHKLTFLLVPISLVREVTTATTVINHMELLVIMNGPVAGPQRVIIRAIPEAMVTLRAIPEGTVILNN